MTRACCHTKSPSTGKRVLHFIQWIVPASMLVLMPKCPVCIAGYVAIATGLGVSIATATYLRYGLLTLCILSLAYLLAIRGRAFFLNIEWRSGGGPAQVLSSIFHFNRIRKDDDK